MRLEEEKDYRTVENVTREAFWNLHQPGCDEHLLVHNLRKRNDFVKELDFVAIADNEIVGNIVYTKQKIQGRDGKNYPILVFGPVCVHPTHQGKGIGSKLINHTIALAKEMDYKAIIIYGYPDYYEKYGFKVSKEYGITNKDGKFHAAMLVLELYPNALKGITGMYDEGDVYSVNEDELKAFDADFPHKVKEKTPSQERFNEYVVKFL